VKKLDMADIDYKSITKQAFDEMADDYIRRDQEVIDETFEVKTTLERFILLLSPKGNILDIGSGGGRDSRFLFDRGFSVTAMDLSEKMMEGAKKIQPAIDYKVMDFENLDFPADEFDGVWANASLHHIPKSNLSPVLKKIRDILKENGVFAIIIKHGNRDGIRENEKFGRNVKRYFAYYETEELEFLLERAGFAIIDSSVTTGGEWLNIFARKTSDDN
jgi:SAM-dependent methyltransferase